MTRRGWFLLLALGVIWGLPYLLIRIAIADYHPVFVAFGRAVVGAAILIPLAHGRGALRAGFGNFGWLALYTVLEIGGPWVLIGYAELHVPTATAGMIVALTPAIAVGLAMAGAPQSISLRKMAGLVAGLCGVAALMGMGGGAPHWPAFAALVLAAFGYAAGPFVIARRLSGVDATGVVAASLLLAALFYLPAVPAHWPTIVSWPAVAAIVALAGVCTALAFVMLFQLIAEVGSARATLVAYINPAVAVLLGVLVLNEPVTLGTIAGFALIAAGTFLASEERDREVAIPTEEDQR